MMILSKRRRPLSSVACRAQISLEYLIIVGVAIALLLPGVYFFYSYSKSNVEGTTNNRLNDVGLKMVATAKSTYSLGNGARQTIEFIMPESVTAVVIRQGGTELSFTYDTPYGPADAVFFSNVIMVNSTFSGDGNISLPHPGFVRYRFESQGRNVSITEVVS